MIRITAQTNVSKYLSTARLAKRSRVMIWDTLVLQEATLEEVSGGIVSQHVMLNPQPIPPGRLDFIGHGHSFFLHLPSNPGCPGPLPLPPNPC